MIHILRISVVFWFKVVFYYMSLQWFSQFYNPGPLGTYLYGVFSVYFHTLGFLLEMGVLFVEQAYVCLVLVETAQKLPTIF